MNKNKGTVIPRYYSIKDAIDAPIEGSKAFIIANERLTRNGGVGRYYSVFPSFKLFLKNRDKFPHCHEIIVDHNNSTPNPSGRLVFDFDIKGIKVPSVFRKQIEEVIITVLRKYFIKVDIKKLVFVWSSSDNPTKISKHLTVKHLYFDDWIKISKIFYKLFCIVWDSKYEWIKSSDLVDSQIVRKHASLRMVGSSKINGYPLTFDNSRHTLTDSLIRIYCKKTRRSEQTITIDNIADGVLANVLEMDTESKQSQFKFKHFGLSKFDPSNASLDKSIFEAAFDIYNKILPNVFAMGKIRGNVLSLIRQAPASCLLSGRFHEHENSYILIYQDSINNTLSDHTEDSDSIGTDTDDTIYYNIRFGCYRNCGKQRTISIGKILGPDLVQIIDSEFHQRIHECQNSIGKQKSRSCKLSESSSESYESDSDTSSDYSYPEKHRQFILHC